MPQLRFSVKEFNKNVFSQKATLALSARVPSELRSQALSHAGDFSVEFHPSTKRMFAMAEDIQAPPGGKAKMARFLTFSALA
jgi:hypothetical protein